MKVAARADNINTIFSMEHVIPHGINYHHIVDGILIGTNQCCQTHFDEMLIKKEGVAADISLEKDRLDQPFGVEFYAWIPVEDHEPPAAAQMDFGVATLRELVRLKKKVYVHCQHGHTRAPTLVAAYLIAAGKSPEEAEAFIKARRPEIHIEEHQRNGLRAYASVVRRPSLLRRLLCR